MKQTQATNPVRHLPRVVTYRENNLLKRKTKHVTNNICHRSDTSDGGLHFICWLFACCAKCMYVLKEKNVPSLHILARNLPCSHTTHICSWIPCLTQCNVNECAHSARSANLKLFIWPFCCGVRCEAMNEVCVLACWLALSGCAPSLRVCVC